jgi:hypothetical protein
MGWVVSVTLRLHFSLWNGIWYSLKRKLGGPRAGLDTEATRKIFYLYRVVVYTSPER